MNYQNDVTLTNEEFQRIYTDKKFRNCVAYAHTCCDRRANPISKRAIEYPKNWAVSQEQIDLAKAEIELSKIRTVSERPNDLILVGMGGQIPAEDSDVTNHRVRGSFLNSSGEKCFVEFQNWNSKHFGHEEGKRYMHIPHAQIEGEEMRLHQSFTDNAKHYTCENILKAVNALFGCSFKAVFVDNFDLSPQDHVSRAA